MTRSTHNRLMKFLLSAHYRGHRFGWIRPRPAVGERDRGPGPGGDCALLAFRKENGPAVLTGHEIDTISDANDRSKGDPLPIRLVVGRLFSFETQRIYYKHGTPIRV